MVVFWTQLDGEASNPAENLVAEAPQQELPLEKDLTPQVHKTSKDSATTSSNYSEKSFSSSASSSSNGTPKKAKAKSLLAAERHYATLKDISNFEKTPSGGAGTLPSALNKNHVPKVGPGKSISLVDSCRKKEIPYQSATLVALRRNGTLAASRIKAEDVSQSLVDKERRKIGYLGGKNKFSTLPRSWKNHVPDLFWNKGKAMCEKCGKKCSGEVLRVHDSYFHISCFACVACKKLLAQGGFFTRDTSHYCTSCYQDKFGQRCATCGNYVEGEVVSALGNTYHQKCFLCARCRQPFPSGEKVTYTGNECLCQRCFQIPLADSPTKSPSSIGPKCSGCKEELVEGQALIALDQQWHIWCFKCASCDTLLHGEYMGKDGLPYCEKDYQSQFGVKCAYCDRFITGKVLQAGDNHHFHPTCARCTKCGDPFGDGEEMYLQGTAIWHPRCGPGPTENGTIINGSFSSEQHINGEPKPIDREKDFDGMSSTASETQFSRSRTPSLNGSFRSNSPLNSLTRKSSGPYRTCSPGLILREYKSSHSPIDITRIYTYSYLAAEPTQSYLKKPIDPYDKPPKSPHFHRPPGETRRISLPKTSSRMGMKVLVDTIQTETPRPKSPKMNNEEPIVLAHFPGARPPSEGQKSRIERDDFPAPPYPYTDPERRRRFSGSSKGVSVDADEVGLDDDDIPLEDPKLKKEEEELSKIATGIGKVFLQQVKEREKIRAYKATHLDPRNASRTPSANKEPNYKLRFESSINASPSRLTDHVRPWDEDEFDGGSYRCSTGRSSATFPSYNVISSYRGEPRPGYNFRSSTLPASGRNGGMIGDYNFTGLSEKTQSTEFSSARSDVSAGSLTEADRTALQNAEMCPSATYSSGFRGYSSSPHFRRSLPNMHHMSSEPPKIYPAHLLLTTNYRLPNDVDRCHLERHLSDTDFEMVFRMTRMEFYRLSEWRRSDLKRRVKLF